MRSLLVALLVAGCRHHDPEPVVIGSPPLAIDAGGQPDARAGARNLEGDRADLDAQIAEAVDGVVAAQSDASRAAAKHKLDTLQRERAAIEPLIQQARCQNNPLAKGC